MPLECQSPRQCELMNGHRSAAQKHANLCSRSHVAPSILPLDILFCVSSGNQGDGSKLLVETRCHGHSGPVVHTTRLTLDTVGGDYEEGRRAVRSGCRYQGCRTGVCEAGDKEDKESERNLRVEAPANLPARCGSDSAEPFAQEHSRDYSEHDRFILDQKLRRFDGLRMTPLGGECRRFNAKGLKDRSSGLGNQRIQTTTRP